MIFPLFLRALGNSGVSIIKITDLNNNNNKKTGFLLLLLFHNEEETFLLKKNLLLNLNSSNSKVENYCPDRVLFG